MDAKKTGAINGKDYTAIKHVYYINDLSDKMAAMDDITLKNYEDKTLIWEIE